MEKENSGASVNSEPENMAKHKLIGRKRKGEPVDCLTKRRGKAPKTNKDCTESYIIISPLKRRWILSRHQVLTHMNKFPPQIGIVQKGVTIRHFAERSVIKEEDNC
jgi:hypothetical protein